MAKDLDKEEQREVLTETYKEIGDEPAGSVQEAENTEKQSVIREIFDYIKLIVLVMAFMFLMQMFVVVNARIPSASMEPTIMTGDQIFGNRLAYLADDPQRYDIVIFKYPDDESRLFIKRVIGLPGDVVDIRDGNVYINGESTPLEDSFCAEEDSTVAGNLNFPSTVPDDSYCMLGDNRIYSKDSRFWDNPFVKKDKILGKAMFRYWPVNKMKVIHGAQDSYFNPDAREK
jgi:signal peptidase I